MSYPLLIVDEEGEAPERGPDLPHESEPGLQLGLRMAYLLAQCSFIFMMTL